ncbi:MAG: hypothetical protein HKN16_10015, partial [Saprospiraceae bacterium]|nr:hypothetical protein [Saprospiraceae bacterium]
MKFSFQIHRVQFTKTFGISKLSRDYQDVIRVFIKKDGISAVGETPAIPYYGLVPEKMIQDLNEKKESLQEVSWETPPEFYSSLETIFPGQSFLRSALDGAAWDWYRQKMDRPIWQLIGTPDPATASASNFTIGLSSPAEMAKEISSNPWPSYKLKLGTDQDEEIIKACLEVTDKPLRIDANGAWTVERAKKLFGIFAENLPARLGTAK